MATKKIITSKASQWKKSIVLEQDIKLPNGVTIKVRKLDLIEQAAAGHIQIPLLMGVVETAKKMSSSDNPWSDTKKEDINKFLTVLKEVAVLACVDPRVSFNPEDANVMDVMEIPMDDLMAIFSTVQFMGGGASSFRRFR